MRLCVLSPLLLAAALASGPGLPAAAPEREDLYDDQPADCELIKNVFCSRASWVSDNDLFKSWQIVPDHIGQDGDLHGHFDSVESLDKWKYLELQTSQGYGDNYEGHIRTDDPDLSGSMMIYVLNKDVLIENEKAYFVYDSILASTNPFVMQRYSLICFHKYMMQTTQNDRLVTSDKNTQVEQIDINSQNAKVERQAVFEKRQDSDMGQAEVPDILFFDEEQNGDVEKKLFSFWSRLQGLSPRGRTLPARARGPGFVYYGSAGGPLSAEPRAARPRPPGQPLRWG